MTTKQKQNIARFKAVQAEAKKLKVKNKKLTHIQAVKQAWAILYSKEKKSPAKKKVEEMGVFNPYMPDVDYSKRIKKAALKKKAVNKKSSVIKFNTGILSGALKLSPEEKRLGLIKEDTITRLKNILILKEKILKEIEDDTKKSKMPYYLVGYDKKTFVKKIQSNKKYLRLLDKQVRELKSLIK